MLPGGQRWLFEYWRENWLNRPHGDREALEAYLMERNWAMLEAFDHGISPKDVAKHFGITLGRLRMSASSFQWQTASGRLDFVDDPIMLKDMHEIIVTIDKAFGWETHHEYIAPLRGIHLTNYYNSGRTKIPRATAKKFLRYLRYYNQEAQAQLLAIARG